MSTHRFAVKSFIALVSAALMIACETTPSRTASVATSTTTSTAGAPQAMIADAEEAFERKEDNRALSLFMPLAHAGDAHAAQRLGDVYRRNKGVPINDLESCNWFEAAATRNARDGYSAVNLGLCYENGKGRAKSASEAARWYRTAADRGNGYGMYNLGLAYEYGSGAPQDFAQAAEWHGRAREKLPPGDAVDATRHFNRSMNHVGTARGDPQAMYSLAIDLFNGHEPEVKDQRRAFNVMRDAATKGALPEAWYIYGSWLWGGLGGAKQDLPLAMSWIKKAADAGHEAAQLRYADALRCGIGGVRKDGRAAEAMLRGMIAKGSWQAASDLSQWYAMGDCGFKKDPALGTELRARADAMQRAQVK